jgi:hypothetical protein
MLPMNQGPHVDEEKIENMEIEDYEVCKDNLEDPISLLIEKEYTKNGSYLGNNKMSVLGELDLEWFKKDLRFRNSLLFF